MASNAKNYKRRAGTSGDHGHKFESDVVCLAYARCLKKYKINKLKSFKIANNMDHVGAFDDIVLRIEYEKNGSSNTELIFIQTKHKENPIKHTFLDTTLLPQWKKRMNEKSAPIYEYIKSFLQIRQIFDESKNFEDLTGKVISSDEAKEIRETMRTVFDCQLEDAQFVYYTNASVGDLIFFEKIQNTDIVTNILDTSTNAEIYKFKIHSTEPNGPFETLFEYLKENEIVSVKQFLKKLRVYVNQESGQSLETTIKNNISTYIDTIKLNVDNDILYKTLYDEIKHFHCGEFVPLITEEVNFVEKIYFLLQIQWQTMAAVTKKYHQWSKIFNEESVKKIYNDVLNRKDIKIEYRKLEKSLALIKCVQLAQKIEEMNKGFLFLYISVNSFGNWREVRNLHSYTKYSKVLVCIDNVPVADIYHVCNTKGESREMIVIISENDLVTDPSIWKQISSTGLEQIMNYKVTFQSFPSTLRAIVGDINLIEILENTDQQKLLSSLLSRVLNNEDVKIGCNLPDVENVYMERRYEANATFLKFKALNGTRDIFLLYPKRNITRNIQNSSKVLIFENEECAKIDFFSRVKSIQNTHLCYVDTSLLVINSQETTQNIIKFKMNDHSLTEGEFFQYIMNNKCTVISDNVGMGKSTALKQLTHYINLKSDDTWVEYIKLNMQEKKLKNIELTTNPFDDVTTLLNLDDEEKMIFQQKCKTDGKVALLFDGFDEISSDSRAHLLRLLKSLINTKIDSIVVSTRPNVKTELTNYLLTFSFSIVGFNYYDMCSYLLKYWSQDLDYKDAVKLPEIVCDIATQAKNMEEIFKDVVAVPLQTKMLAEIYKEKIIKIISSEQNCTSFDLLSTLSLYSLYNNFINMYIDRCLKEKFNLDENSSGYEIAKDAIFKTESGIWEAIACREMFPTVKMLETTESYIDRHAMQKIGIFLITDPKTYTFVHRSFAEFLAAKHVTKLLYESKNAELLNFIYQEICVKKTFYVLRKFMNVVYEYERQWENAEINFVPGLEVNFKLLISLLENNAFIFKVILRHLSKNQNIMEMELNQKYDGQSLLHDSISYCEQVFDDILSSKFFYSATDINENGFTALHLACMKGKENAVISYMRKFNNKSLSDILNQTDTEENTPLMLAAGQFNINIIKVLHERGASLFSKNDAGETALMIASRNGSLEIVKYLVEQGADINAGNGDGMTTLMYVSDVGDVDMVEYLLQQEGIDVNKQDCRGKTALMYAAVFGDDVDILKRLIDHGADIGAVDSDRRTAYMLAAMYGRWESFKWFINKGVDVLKKVDANGDTCFTLCSAAENISVLQYFFKNHKPNLKYKNYQGETALFKAILNGRIDNVKLLITHGARFKFCNKNGDFTVILLIEKNLHQTIDEICFNQIFWNRFPGILRYLIQNGTEVIHQNHLGNSALHMLLRFTSPLLSRYLIVKVINELIEHGADINLKNKKGVTPAMMAQNHKFPEVKSYFEELRRIKKSPP